MLYIYLSIYLSICLSVCGGEESVGMGAGCRLLAPDQYWEGHSITQPGTPRGHTLESRGSTHSTLSRIAPRSSCFWSCDTTLLLIYLLFEFYFKETMEIHTKHLDVFCKPQCNAMSTAARSPWHQAQYRDHTQAQQRRNLCR